MIRVIHKKMKNYFFNQNLEFSIENENKQKTLNPNQVRIRMRNCGICGSDIHYFLYGENGGRKIQEAEADSSNDEC